jgi:hypothetical protein
MRAFVVCGLAVIALITALWLGDRARLWNDELALPSPPLAHTPPRLDDPHTPRLTEQVVLIVIDGLGIDESHLPLLDELRERGAAAIARVPYPTISRPNYVTLLTGVPPRDSGVRANRVEAPVAVDTVMDRLRTAGLRVATASDYGSLGSLFLRGTPSITGIDWVERGVHVAPPPPITWPFDDAVRVGSLDALGPAIAELAAGGTAFVPVLVLDVDRAGHAAGIGAEYRATAAAVDRMLRVAFAGIDLTRDTVIVTADHGHVAPGGHGGTEREVSHVPLIFAGRGIVPGALAHDPRSIDVAPTVAALLGVPAPGHADGRALVELLRLAPADATRRAAFDAARTRSLAAVVDAALADSTRPSAIRLLALAAGLALAGALAVAMRRRGALAITPATAAGALGFAVMAFATLPLTRGQLSPSYVPSLARTQQLGAFSAAVALAIQVAVTSYILHRAPDRLAAAAGLAFIGLVTALASVAAVRAWFSPPYLEVPPPFWLVAIPALDVAAAVGALGALITLVLGAYRSHRSRR